jgi:hypothetical protein
MFGIGKRTVYKVLKGKSEEFSDLVLLGEGNVEDFLAVSRVCASLYDQKAKLRADYSHPNIKGDLTGGCPFCEDFQI